MEAIDFIKINQLGAIAFAVNPCVVSISAVRAARNVPRNGRGRGIGMGRIAYRLSLPINEVTLRLNEKT